MVNVGIIGCGSITKFRHAPEYSSNCDAKIIGFFDQQTERAKEMAGIFGGKTYESVEELLADKSIEAVSVCTANRFHASITIAALRAGKHVLCEKPMATAVEDAEKMIEEAGKSGKTLMVGHNQRLTDAHVRAKKIIDCGELGRIISFRTTFSHGGPESWSADKSGSTWFFSKKDAVMGAMGDLGIHKADLIRWLIGDEIAEVTASVLTLDKRGQDGGLIEVDDNALCILRSETGITGTLTVGWTNYGAEDNSTVLYCSEGVIRIYDNPEFPLEIAWKNGEKTFYKIGKIQTNENQTKSGVIDMFIDSLVRGVPPEITGRDGLAALKIIFACMKSSEEGRKIIINYY